MELMVQLFGILLGTIVLQNTVFSRALGIVRIKSIMKTPKTVILFGAMTTAVTTAASIVIWPINELLKNLSYRLYIRSVVFILLLCVFYLILVYLARLPEQLKLFLPLAVFNSAVLGTLILASMRGLSWLGFVVSALGSGIGYTLALLLIFSALRQVKLCRPPRSFRGLPVTLLYIGMVSLAICGLIGYQLPS